MGKVVVVGLCEAKAPVDMGTNVWGIKDYKVARLCSHGGDCIVLSDNCGVGQEFCMPANMVGVEVEFGSGVEIGTITVCGHPDDTPVGIGGDVYVVGCGYG